jgi:hypothetical protein
MLMMMTAGRSSAQDILPESALRKSDRETPYSGIEYLRAAHIHAGDTSGRCGRAIPRQPFAS